MKKLLLGVGILFILLVLLVLLVPFLVDLNAYQAQYIPIIEDTLNRKVTLKDVRLTIWPRIGARVAGFTVLDDPAFSTGTFASLKSLDVGVKLGPLLQKRVEVEEITLRDPIITVIKNSDGVMNISTLGKKTAAKPEKPAPAPPAEGPLHVLAMLAVDKVSLKGGRLVYTDQAAKTEYMLQDLEFLLKSVRLGQSPSLYLATTVQPFKLPVKMDGKFGPLEETADIQNFDFVIGLGKTTLNLKGSAVGGDTKVTLSSPSINTAELPVALPLKKPVEVKDVQMAAELKEPEATLQNLSFNLFGGQVKAQGGMTRAAKPSPFHGKVAMQGVQLGPVLEAFGTDKVSISGTASTDLSVAGKGFTKPEMTDALQGTGHLSVKDGKLEGMNLLKEAFALLKAAGITQSDVTATVFSVLETDLGIKRGIIMVERLLMDSHDFQATGNGTIGFDQALNLKLKLNLSEALSRTIAGTSPMAKLAASDGRISVPLVISGTAQAPAYALDTTAMAGKVQEQVKEKAQEKVRELLKGKGAGDTPQKPQETLKKLFGQ